MTTKIRNILLGLLSALCLTFAAAVVYVLIVLPESVEAPIAGRFALIGDDGQPVTEAAFKGRYMLIYFGYTFCPDVCPTELAKMTAALDGFADTAPAQAEKIVPIFISVDPERDTPERLKDYAVLFHPDLVAMTGTAEQIRAVAATYRVYYAKVYPAGGATGEGDYLMDHSSQIYLMGPDATYVTHFSAAATAKNIADALARLVK